MVLIFF